MKISNGIVFFALFALSACGQLPAQTEEQCTSASCSETDINAPLPGTTDDPSTPPETAPSIDPSSLNFPEFNAAWGLKRSVYDKAVENYRLRWDEIAVKQYVVVVDFSQHSSKKRFYLFDLAKGTVERHAVAHGLNSDRNNDGYADSFSNAEGSLQSSLGFYLTLATYQGKYGYSMRLSGKDSTNSNAQARAVVVHPAPYVSDSSGKAAGRSWGCPALDPSISANVIKKIKNGAMFYIGR